MCISNYHVIPEQLSLSPKTYIVYFNVHFQGLNLLLLIHFSCEDVLEFQFYYLSLSNLEIVCKMLYEFLIHIFSLVISPSQAQKSSPYCPFLLSHDPKYLLLIIADLVLPVFIYLGQVSLNTLNFAKLVLGPRRTELLHSFLEI